jgi:hypothetical protein
LIIVILLAAILSPERHRPTAEAVNQEKEDTVRTRAVVLVGIFFWILVVSLIVAIVTRYIYSDFPFHRL